MHPEVNLVVSFFVGSDGSSMYGPSSALLFMSRGMLRMGAERTPKRMENIIVPVKLFCIEFEESLEEQTH